MSSRTDTRDRGRGVPPINPKFEGHKRRYCDPKNKIPDATSL